MDLLEMDNLMKRPLPRRDFLRLGLCAAAGLALPWPALASLGEQAAPERTLSLFNVHTGERLLGANYWVRGEYQPDALAEIDYLLRDYRTDEVQPIDPQLLDMLHRLSRRMGTDSPFSVISGFRSPETNQMLRQAGGGGVARKSLHMSGRAIDIRLPGRELENLRRAAVALRGGGVGYYPRDGFVHLDTGRVRTW